jgi:hypothetical protein
MFTNKKQNRINNLVFGIVLSLAIMIMIPSSITYAAVVITPVIGNNNSDGFNDDGTYTNNSDIPTITQPQSHDSKSHDIVCQNMASILNKERSASLTAQQQLDTLNDYISECASYNE